MSLRGRKEKSWAFLGGLAGAILGVFWGAYVATFLLHSNNFDFDIICVPEIVGSLAFCSAASAVAGFYIFNTLPGGLSLSFKGQIRALLAMTPVPIFLSISVFQRITTPMSDNELLSLFPKEKRSLTALIPIIKQDPDIAYAARGDTTVPKPVPQAHIEAFIQALGFATPAFISVSGSSEDGYFKCALWSYNGCERGFAYLPTPPKPSEIYKDLSFNRFSYECTTVFKHIEGHWYLFYYCDPS